jgi:lauroyl/myristoyl acyltransferase
MTPKESQPAQMWRAARAFVHRHDRQQPLVDSAPGTSLICAKDLYEMPRLLLQGLIAWTTPELIWWPLSRLFGLVNAITHPKRRRTEITQIRAAAAGTPFSDRSLQIAIANWANRYEERFQYLRAWRPGGWNPKVEIRGQEHVETARRNGRGIIFWTGNFSFNDLVTKMAWHRLGVAVDHFSRPAHGFSTTRFGIRYLNAVRRKIEDRYLRERIMATESETRSALQLLRRRLELGGAASFTVGGRGRRTASAAFLGGELTLATGPLFLAQSSGAVVLPVFTLRRGPRRFEVTIGEAIDLSGSDYGDAVQAYADLLTPYVLRDPEQWRGWRYVR